ncbi:CARDB domain-containing protein [Haloarculaceae archaeon H-GB2-1]|nr:CARDB domain-containing protein [Haloarculaceae archaeon H-GB2-1]
MLRNDATIVRGGPVELVRHVVTARNVRVRVATERLSDDLSTGLAGTGNSVVVGEVGPDEPQTATFEFQLNDSIRPGTYEIPFEVTYEYTPLIRYGGDETEWIDRDQREIVTVPLVVRPQVRLDVEGVDQTDLVPGSVGTYTFQVRNTGTETASEVGLRIAVDNTSVFVGGRGVEGSTTSVFIERLRPGDSQTITVTAGAYPETTNGTYLVSVTPRYQTASGRTSLPTNNASV